MTQSFKIVLDAVVIHVQVFKAKRYVVSYEMNEIEIG